MKGFSHLHVKSAAKSRFHDTLSMSHLTTAQIGQIIPLFAQEMYPGDKFSVKSNYFSRLAPLVKPTYGDFFFKTVSVFVPYCQLAYDWEGFYAGNLQWQGISPDQRYINYGTLVNFMINSNVTNSGTAANYDFSYTDASGNLTYRRLTSFGKYVLKVLNALGYSLPQNVDLQTTSSWYGKFYMANISAMPLLSFFKAYNDYMAQSQRYNTSTLTNALRCIKYNLTLAGYTPATHVISSSLLLTLFQQVRLCYENDYFTSAWQNPNSPLYSSNNINSISPNISNDIVVNTTQDDLLQTSVSQISAADHRVYIHQRALDFLKSFDDWVRRNNYAGSRAVQQIYARFGIKVDDYRSHYADVIKTDSMEIQVGDVTSMAETTNQPLGYYAGKGIVSGSEGFQYKASDYGMLLVLGYVTLRPFYAYGMDRHCLRVSAMDYYQPEFDGLGAEAISYGEVFSDPKNSDASDTSLDDQVFGFTERYNSYRFFRDKITGDFRNYDNNADMNTWHTGRLLQSVRAAGEMVAQSSSMNTLPQFDSEYARIFSITTGVDQFYFTCKFICDVNRNMMSLNQVPRLGEGDVNIPRNGNEIN